MSGGLEYVQGGPPANPDEVVVDEYYANRTKSAPAATSNCSVKNVGCPAS